ncbi:hypothetical protein CPT_Moonbeam234 [Bacillus phage Moonbeam]|uniref:Uncharacterized protein n=1 Tax=Bacillus phage Moonbeam TaxID=1540091 RepID=A0A0A0RSB6_9CAUD|nr:hypothetical protein CPT_Moonbeam3 [Bacillus phage Moonbeam]YP_009151797.1 hypothetical protein CPT_Moonbeam234 [Bacillus phage Moonbeam]AIW03401.1 hypothetical protein CPT_Moonbeam3 [Bacillus phage Moonbeam]AIW03632.1 hypothetical protein CPT_Moonbeam234 [Bacillus phage Moonbeam]
METMSVWVSMENYHKYMQGEEVFSWNTYNKNSPLNINVPLENITHIEDLGAEGIEIDIKRK